MSVEPRVRTRMSSSRVVDRQSSSTVDSRLWITEDWTPSGEVEVEVEVDRAIARSHAVCEG